ncbi:MAG: hypothetical protein LWX83_16995, partial [Anaerolineae bacterium]|nr:hypothetical protein [Anaerolineae bacterium]
MSSLHKLFNYLQSCIWLFIAVMAFNLPFMTRLPAPYQMQVFWKDIPLALGLGENFFRFLIFAIFPLLMCFGVLC